MTPNKLPPLPELIRRIRYWSECQDATPLIRHELGRIADDFEALRQSQSLPAGAVAGLVGKWRDHEHAGNSSWGDGYMAAMKDCAFDLEQALQADAREKGEVVPQRLLTELYGLAQGDLPDGDGVSVSVAMWANNWLYELTQPAQASENGASAVLGHMFPDDLEAFRRGDCPQSIYSRPSESRCNITGRVSHTIPVYTHPQPVTPAGGEVSACHEMSAIHARLLTEADNLLALSIKSARGIAHPPVADAALARDAVRYRFLIPALYRDDFTVGEAAIQLHTTGPCPTSDEIGAAIDAALSQRGGGRG